MITTQGKTVPEVLAEVLQAAIDQGGRCTTDSTCLYGDGDKHCFIGWLLPEDSTNLMGFVGGFEELLDSGLNLGVNGAFIRDNEDVLHAFQNLHDMPVLFGSETLFDALEALPEAEAKLKPLTDQWLALCAKTGGDV